LIADSTVVVEAADTATWFSWTRGRLAFTNAFRKAIPKLNRWYDLDLRVADSTIGNAVLVATLPDRPLEGTIQAIAFALSARIEQQGNVITFFPTADTLR
jgi:ferric-dicitrate binding protein FerR (iron transport regulator)